MSKKKLGRIEKPSVQKYAAGRKLYCVPLVFSGKDAPEDYQKLYDTYWTEVKEHIEKLGKVGRAAKIYHESIYSADQDSLESIKQQNKRSHELVESEISQGAELIALEEKRLFGEYMDWGVCLSIVRTPEVAEKIQNFYLEAEKRRDEYILKQIDETLKDGEAGILLMKDENRIRIQPKLPSDIHVFLVHPPALNDVSQWIRDRIRDTYKKLRESVDSTS